MVFFFFLERDGGVSQDAVPPRPRDDERGRGRGRLPTPDAILLRGDRLFRDEHRLLPPSPTHQPHAHLSGGPRPDLSRVEPRGPAGDHGEGGEDLRHPEHHAEVHQEDQGAYPWLPRQRRSNVVLREWRSFIFSRVEKDGRVINKDKWMIRIDE